MSRPSSQPIASRTAEAASSPPEQTSSPLKSTTSSSDKMQLPPPEGMSAVDMWSYLSMNCMKFVFPDRQAFGLAATIPQAKNVTVPRPQIFHWVTVFAKYGPGVRVEEDIMDHTIRSRRTATAVQLKGGLKRLLQAHEVKQLLDEEERSFLCEVYNGGDGVTAPVGCSGRSGATRAGEVHKSFRAESELQSTLHRSTTLGSVSTAPTKQQTSRSCSVSLGAKSDSSRHRRVPPAALQSIVAPNTYATAIDDSVVGELMNKRHPAFYSAVSITVEELEEVLGNAVYPTQEKDGKALRWSTIADAMSTALLAERQRRIEALKTTTPNVPVLRSDPRITNRRAAYFLCKTHPKPRDIRRFDNPQDVIVALHRYAYQVSDFDVETQSREKLQEPGRGKPTAAELTNNIKCVRKDFVADPTRPGWDATCCLGGTQGTVPRLPTSLVLPPLA